MSDLGIQTPNSQERAQVHVPSSLLVSQLPDHLQIEARRALSELRYPPVRVFAIEDLVKGVQDLNPEVVAEILRMLRSNQNYSVREAATTGLLNLGAPPSA